MFANRCYGFFFFFYFLPDIDWQLPFHMQKPFITPLCLAASDNETDKNFNEEKNVISSRPFLFRRCLKTTAATLSPAPMRMTAHPQIRSTTPAPPMGQTKITAPTAT